MFPRCGCTAEPFLSFPPGPDRSGSGDSNLLSFSQMELSSSTQSRLHPPLLSCDHDCSLTKAKRARVESIIRGMVCTEQRHAGTPESAGESEETGQHLHLRRSFSHDCGGEEKPPLYGLSGPPGGEGARSDSRRKQGWRKLKLMSFFQSRPERLQLMADVFKSELSRAVSRSVDALFRSMPLLQEGDAAPQAEEKWSFSCCGAAEVQTEALSLVVQRPDLERSEAPSTLLCHDSSSEAEEQGSGRSSTVISLQDEEQRRDARWTSVKSKVNSRSVRSPHHQAVVEPILLESLKMESDGVVRSNLYALNEGLTANHLKKAKLMFFYTRYPSSLVLRSCFHDVQFTRCITSQLIKWFSNFREFYYIQMEKFARAALVDGRLDVRDLTVGRESELFRALNMHYNKANDFQVPDCFLVVAEVTLREFYAAISLGKDRDPSWKKAIYKVICKLDSDVPAQFRIHQSV
ncbi:uncharacterized protein LOC112158018 [Oryzias melastigma]|uniref:Prospero homeobox protein 2-like n=1 Tax=Oryzias melastigma TaxID=30732 RepID=A0A3B3CIA7_ORYME|nr:uncharacterized protein LOC112158018 [Oryzias melastigma]XP_024146946.1 uncharacterized protein LOC112158018 [Oryzias melastigma]XP_024146947.1 uncharacterized protein LOC112158018 [Oryzias melastigma]